MKAVRVEEDMARLVVIVMSWLLLAPSAGRAQACAEPHYRWSEKVDTALQARPAVPVDIAAILTAWAPLSLTSRAMCAPRRGREDSVFVRVGLVSGPMLGAQLPLASALPFVALLAAIALLPLVAPRWWHPNRNKALLAVVVSVPVLWQLGIALGEPGRAVLEEKLHEYVGFIVVIGALFVITGGIHVQGSLSGTPLVNTGMLGLGAVLANLLGTTGASVLLIRPLLRANKSRRRTAHIVVFFIFLVANCGGLLTPMGDPPLLLGFLKGVPFEWTLRLWPQWLTATGALLVTFNVWA